jgi:hypothetical protein
LSFASVDKNHSRRSWQDVAVDVHDEEDGDHDVEMVGWSSSPNKTGGGTATPLSAPTIPGPALAYWRQAG